MAFVEPVAVFFGSADPGVVAAIIGGATVYGQLERDLDETLESTTVRGVPVFICAASDVAAVAVGDTVTVGALAYKVRVVETSEYDPIAVVHLNNP